MGAAFCVWPPNGMCDPMTRRGKSGQRKRLIFAMWIGNSQGMHALSAARFGELMIFAARLVSLIGAALAFSGLAALFVISLAHHVLPEVIMSKGILIFAMTSLGGVLLVIGQAAGNDLFTLRGKNGLFKLHEGQRRYGGNWDGTGGGHDFGGD